MKLHKVTLYKTSYMYLTELHLFYLFVVVDHKQLVVMLLCTCTIKFNVSTDIYLRNHLQM